MTIPDDIRRTADELVERWYAGRGDLRELQDAIAEALTKEREKQKDHWLAWSRKRMDISREFWLRASKKALSGDMAELRNRVELSESGPVEIVLSADNE